MNPKIRKVPTILLISLTSNGYIMVLSNWSQVQMPVDKAVDMLIYLGLVLEKKVNGTNVLEVIPCSSAYDSLRKRWDHLLF